LLLPLPLQLERWCFQQVTIIRVAAALLVFSAVSILTLVLLRSGAGLEEEEEPAAAAAESEAGWSSGAVLAFLVAARAIAAVISVPAS